MMHSLFPVPLPGTAHTYATDLLHDDLSRQMALSQASRRLSRGSNGQRPGTAMRIVKPTSANNSPRSSTLLGRRKTLMNDGNMVRRRLQLADQASLALAPADMPDVRSARPVSWHPGSLPQAQPQVSQPASQYPFPVAAFADAELYPSYAQFPPTPAAYSCNTSPSATFSPLALPFNGFETSPYVPVEGWNAPAQPTPSYVSPSSEGSAGFSEPFPALSTTSTETAASASALEWNSFVMNGFNGTSPPTPQTIPPSQQPQLAVPAEESIPYESLEEAEEEGEILVGMGLYDAPAKYDSDPQLENYRSTVSSLLGSTFRLPQATGKGLKLEESWQPPEETDDEDEDDADEDENEDEEEKKPRGQSAPLEGNWI